MIRASVLAARGEFYNRALPTQEYLSYVRLHHLEIMAIGPFAGGCGVLSIVECGSDRFDFGDEGQLGFVCEAYGEDGETVVDLVAWPLDRPASVMTMFGRCGLLGAWEAINPATYFMGYPLTLHRTALDWLQAGCRGAAVITPRIAARMLLDLPGRIAAQDHAHGREIAQLIASVVDRNKVIVPSCIRRAA